MKLTNENSKIVTHDYPVWRSRANFMIRVRLNDVDIADVAESEQIWARQIKENVFEICCIPFSAFDLALGDLVSTTTVKGEKYIVDKIVERKGHFTYRVFFRDEDKWNVVVENIQHLDCLVEKRWEKSMLVGIDAPSREVAVNLESYLTELEANEIVEWETGLK